MRRILTALISVALCGPASTAMADDLLQIYDMAVVSDPSLREAEQVLFATREVKPQALALLLPNLSVQGDVDYQDVDTNGQSSSGSFSYRQDFTTRSVQAVVSQSVYNRANWMTLKKSDNVIAQAEAQYRNAQIDLMVRTTEAYFTVLRAADAVTVQEALLRANERQLEQSKQRFEVGLVAITDVNESQAAYDRARAELISAKNLLDNAWESLRTIIGPVQVPLARLGEKLPLAPPAPNDIMAWADAALRGNYGILAATEATTAAKRDIQIERSGYYPTVDLQAGYDVSRTGAEIGSDTDTGFVGLSLNVPIFQGGAVASRTREAGYRFRASQDQLDQVRRQVDQQVKDAFRGILSSIEDVKARQASIVSARSALESTQAGLEVGTRTQVDVLNAQRNLFQAEFDYLSSRYDYFINGVKLHQATSTLTRDILAKGNAWLIPSDVVQPPAD
ncbi:TolC family outer membrane protein [Thiorhodococcus mannitoliphagus]|uniref:TolC family outer membrane protein n=1 Tax=Thiorhodococcus mannitoliphagus TaxID=329406 RepID=A0A6P1E204_9GAMM|nr:TolC family outer membrane protein [Thiorhodococcus mannitoliphagus]NEX23243.1 TolC family outer membrane protein [Thiorhodococcus mannitoliphagus]